MARDTWAGRDLVALDYIVTHFDEQPELWLRLSELEGVLGSRAAAVAAVRALGDEDEPYIVGREESSMAGYDFVVQGVTARARRAVRSWPTPDSAADQLVAALEQAVRDAATPEEKSKSQRALDAVRGLPQAVVAGVMSTVIGATLTG